MLYFCASLWFRFPGTGFRRQFLVRVSQALLSVLDKSGITIQIFTDKQCNYVLIFYRFRDFGRKSQTCFQRSNFGGPSLNLAAVYMKNLGSWGNQVTKQFTIHNTGI